MVIVYNLFDKYYVLYIVGINCVRNIDVVVGEWVFVVGWEWYLLLSYRF